jgi:RNA polymerase sigma factor (TIGR02999 family)
MSDVTRLIETSAAGNPRAAELLPLVYDELRKLAAAQLASETPGQTLDATALVHEAYLRLAGQTGAVEWDNRGHFFAAAAEAMRRILVEAARRKRRTRHGGGRRRVALPDAAAPLPADPDDVLALDDALARLAAEDPAAARVAGLRLFAGLSVEDAAAACGVSRATAYRNWTYARAWLKDDLADPVA